jgi:diacylglycerol kinase (ATP)
LAAFANAQSYGGGMRVAPLAELQDGLLDLVVVGEFGRIEFLANFPKVLKGVHLRHPKVRHVRFRSLQIESDAPVPILIDGELLPPGPLTIEVVPAALDVIVGKGFGGRKG